MYAYNIGVWGHVSENNDAYVRSGDLDEDIDVSICIPAYEMGGAGAHYLAASLKVVAAQRSCRFEVIVSDQSNDDEVRNVCLQSNCNVRWIDARHVKHNAAANVNNAILHARGRLIKILFQDDYLLGPDSLSRLSAMFQETAVSWCVTGSAHTRDGATLERFFVPSWHERIHFGRNTVSSPSVLAFRNYSDVRFDEKLIWLMDVDFYKQCSLKWGPPRILPDAMVVNRLHSGQVSSGISRALKRHELDYILQKYRHTMNWVDWWYWLGQMRRTWL